MKATHTTQKTLFGNSLRQLPRGKKLRDILPPHFNNIQFRTLPTLLKRQILENKIKVLKSKWYQEFRATPQDTKNKIQELKKFLSYLHVENRPLKRVKDITPRENLIFRKSINKKDTGTAFKSFTQDIKQCFNVEQVWETTLGLKHVIFSIETLREKDEIRKDNDNRKELGLMNGNPKKIQQLETFIVRYVQAIYEPILKTLKAELNTLNPLLDPYFNAIDEINAAIEDQQWNEQIWINDDLQISIIKEEPHAKTINGKQMTFPTQALQFNQLPPNKQQFIIKTIKETFIKITKKEVKNQK